MRRVVVLVGPLMLAACARATCCPCEGVARPVVGVPPVAAPAAPAGSRTVNPIASTPAPSAKPSFAAVAGFRARVEAAAKGEGRVEAVAALVRAHPAEARALDLETWASSAPGAVLVYDLRPLLEAGSDVDVAMLPYKEEASNATGDDPRVTRLAMALLPAAFAPANPAFVLRDDGIVFVADLSHAAAVEARLDRVAMVGGGQVRVRCVAVPDPDGVATELRIAAVAPNTDPAAPLTAAGMTVSPIEAVTDDAWQRAVVHGSPVSVDAVAGCVRGSKRTTTASYVNDFDVREAGPCIADPVIATIEAGFAVSAYLASVAAPQEVVLELSSSHLVLPMKTFTTNLTCAHVAPGGVPPTLEVEIPTLRAAHGRVTLPARVGAGAFVRFGGLFGVLARVEAVTVGSEPKPAWRRVFSAPLAAVLSLPGEKPTHFLEIRVQTQAAGASEPTMTAAPNLLVPEGQSATISMLKGMSYIADIDVEGSQDAVIANPIVASIETGLTIGARVLSRPDGTASIDGTLTIADVSMPLRRKTLSLGVGAPVQIDLPTSRQTSESFRVIAREGEPATISLSVPTEQGPTQVDVTIAWRRHTEPLLPAPK